MKRFLLLALLGLMSLLLVGCDQIANLTGAGTTTKAIDTEESQPTEDVEGEIPQLSKLSGYELNLKVKGESTDGQAGFTELVLGKKNNTTWVTAPDGGMALKQDAQYLHLFSYDEENKDF